jgi:hypothetical protein
MGDEPVRDTAAADSAAGDGTPSLQTSQAPYVEAQAVPTIDDVCPLCAQWGAQLGPCGSCTGLPKGAIAAPVDTSAAELSEDEVRARAAYERATFGHLLSYRDSTEEYGAVCWSHVRNFAECGIRCTYHVDMDEVRRRIAPVDPEPVVDEARMDDAWQTIETAPKDGTFIVLLGRLPSDTSEYRVRATVTRWWEYAPDNPAFVRGWSFMAPGYADAFIPTHWTPLPHGKAE